MSEHEETKARLDDICREARDAAAEIETAFDKIFDACDKVRQLTPDKPQAHDALSAIYETGSVQDVVRQRMDKIARTVARLIDPSLPEQDALLGGPRHSGDKKGLQQDDVNRLLNNPD